MIGGKKQMKRKCLAIGISTVSVIILILTSLTNVVGYQSVQTSQQNIIKERINQRELLFQTIVDIANNKEIQRVILKSQMSKGIFPTSEFPVVTKNQIRQMYFLGMILSKVISKSRIHSMVQQYQYNNQEIQNEINAVIEKDTIINSEITQLKDSECDCEMDTTAIWYFPILCIMLLIMDTMGIWFIVFSGHFLLETFGFFLNVFVSIVAPLLHCSFTPIIHWSFNSQ
jgi:hypothetical protein